MKKNNNYYVNTYVMAMATVLLSMLAFISHCRSTGLDSVECTAIVNAVGNTNNSEWVRSCQWAMTNPCQSNVLNDEVSTCWPTLRTIKEKLEDYSSTRGIGSCPKGRLFYGGCVPRVNNTSISGLNYRVKYGSLLISLELVNPYMHNVTVRWKYVNNNPSPNYVKAYRLTLQVPETSVFKLCVCFNSSLNLTQYSFIMNHKNPILKGTLTAEIFTLPYAKGTTEEYYKRSYTIDLNKAPSCAYTQANFQPSKKICGLPMYGRPRYVSVRKNDTSTVISWEKPCFSNSSACTFYDYVDSEKYYITARIIGGSETYNFEVCGTTEIMLNTSISLDVEVHAYIPCSGIYEKLHDDAGIGNGCSLPGRVDDDKTHLNLRTCCSFLPNSIPAHYSTPPNPSIMTSGILLASNLNPSPTVTSHTFFDLVSFIVAPTIIAVVIVVTVFILIVVLLLYLRHCNGHGSGNSSNDIKLLPQNRDSDVSALVVCSPRMPDAKGRVIKQALITHFRDNYGIFSNIPELRGPQQNVQDWIVEQHETANAVFCVCNKYFYEEWNQQADLGVKFPIVYCFKNLFEGSIKSTKYAVVLVDQEDKVYIPPLLRGRPVYMIDDFSGMARFVKNKPICEN